MKSAAWAILFCLIAWEAQADAGPRDGLASSVVHIHIIADPPDILVPWQTEGIRHSVGSGVLIAGRRILTNAHVVESAVAIEVRRSDQSERFQARVAFVSHDADLAILEVEDERFFHGSQPIPIGDMPRLRQSVDVYGFPIGGQTISITSGIVSRIEVGTYTQSFRKLLSVQVDAAVNPGNSGGPVVSDGAIVGIAMQRYGSAEADNVGYMVPAPVIEHFLKDVADGRYDGFPRLGIEAQDMQSGSLRTAYRMKESQTGVLVVHVDYGGPSHGTLRPGDVILEVEGRSVANDGSIAWRDVARIDYAHLVQTKQIGEELRLTVLRDGKAERRVLRLTAHTPLVPGRRLTELPRYFVFAGLVFRPLSEELLDEGDLYPDSEMYALLANVVTEERREIIVLERVLPHPVNRGYREWGGETVRSVNGIVPRDFEHLVRIIEDADARWVRIVTGDGFLVVIDTRSARASTEPILVAYGIPEDRYLGPKASTEPRRRRRRRR